MKRRGYVALMILMAMVFCISGMATAEWTPELKFMKLAASRPGGKWYTLGAPLVKIWEKALPGVRITLIPGGGISNPKSVNNNEAQVAWSLSPDIYNAVHANPPFDKPNPNLRHMASTYTAYMEIVVPKNSAIKGIPDLYNKRISGGAVGFTTVNILEFVLKAYGMSFDSVKAKGGSVQYLGYGDMVLSMKDGHLDCAAFMGGIPFSTIIELNVQPGIRFLEIDDKHMAEIVARNPGFVDTELPKGTYKGQDKPVRVVGAFTCLFVHKDLSDEMVYRMTKSFWENLNLLNEVAPGTAKEINIKDAFKGIACPLHPGAKRYYDEIGMHLKQ